MKSTFARRPAKLQDANFPVSLAPMLARPSLYVPKPDEAYGFEFKWDGIRAILFWDGRNVRVQSRSLRDITHEYPELQALGKQLGRRRVVLDGEIVALGDDGSPRFERMQQRLGVAASAVHARMQQIAVTYMIFDVIHLDGVDLKSQPYSLRREALNKLNPGGSHWRTPPCSIGGGDAMLETSKMFRIEGIVAKRLDSEYESGLRTGAWLKIKNQRRNELIIAGWMPGEGRRENTIGSLLLGYYDIPLDVAKKTGARQRLLYAGKAGTGFSDAMLDSLFLTLKKLQIPSSPFEPSRQIPRGAKFAKPERVGEFEFTEWTHLDILRHPSFKGLRNDKDPRDVVREEIL